MSVRQNLCCGLHRPVEIGENSSLTEKGVTKKCTHLHRIQNGNTFYDISDFDVSDTRVLENTGNLKKVKKTLKWHKRRVANGNDYSKKEYADSRFKSKKVRPGELTVAPFTCLRFTMRKPPSKLLPQCMSKKCDPKRKMSAYNVSNDKHNCCGVVVLRICQWCDLIRYHGSFQNFVSFFSGLVGWFFCNLFG